MKRTAIVVFVLGTLSVSGGLASAGVQNQFPTFFVKFKLEASTSSGETFAGKIDSAKGNCVKGRKVVVFRKKSGDKTKLGSDKTDGKGEFSVGVGNGKPKNGKYYATVKELSFDDDNGEKQTCLDAMSGSVTIS
ncbi:MAG: hypothetical protein ACR2OC_04475 [Solirubrobacterales bacterium]